MANQPIDKSSIIKDGAIESIIQGFEDLKANLKSTDDELKKVASSMGQIVLPKNTKQFSELAAAVKILEEAFKKQVKTQTQLANLDKEKVKFDSELEKLAQQRIKTEKEKEALKQAQNRTLQQEIREKERLAKIEAKNAKGKEREKNAYLRLSDATRDYKNESKRLGAELLSLAANGKRNTKEYRELAKAYQEVTNKAKAGDAQLKKLDKTVGDNFREVGNYAKATQKLSAVLGKLGIAFGLSTIVRSTTGVIKDYDQSITDLGAITQKTTEELKPLNDQARELGATTQFSATQITQLQIELAKLGFTTQEIMDSTGGIANFAAATGVEIPRAAALAGSALRAFNLDAKEIDRVVSTLGVATTKTALDFSQLENGLSTVAPVAAAFGFSIEDTTALLGQLANAGFDASSSATATRNILLNLADANGELAKQLGRPIKSADDLAVGLKELQDRGVDLAQALELTDKRSVAAFATFLSGSDKLVGLRDSITDVNGELQKMAEDRLNSVSGAMAILNSAYEEHVLKLNETIGASEGFKTTIRFIADNLGTILKVIGRVIAAYTAYKVVLIAVNIQQKLAGRSLGELAKSFFTLKRGADQGATAVSGVGKALKGIGWTALIAAAIELSIAFYDIASGAKEARRRAEELEAFKDKSAKKAENFISKRNSELNDELNNIRRNMELASSAAKTEEERNAITIKYLADKKEIIEANSKAIRNEMVEGSKSIADFQTKLNALNKITKEIDGADRADDIKLQIKRAELAAELSEELGMTGTAWFGLIESSADFTEIQSRLEASIEGVKDELELYNKELKASNDNLIEAETVIKVDSNERENNRNKVNAQIVSMKDLNKELEEQKKIYNSILELQESLWFRNLDDESQEVVKRMQQLDAELELLGSDTLMREEDKQELRKKLIEDSEKDILKIKDNYLQKAKEKETADLEKASELVYEQKKNEILNLKQSDEEFKQQMLDAEISHLEDILKIRKDAGLETIELENDIALLRRTKTEEQTNVLIKSISNQVYNSTKFITDMYKDAADQAIAVQNRLIDNSNRMIDSLKASAMAGNIQAKESILAEEKAIEESQRRIEKAQKKKARMDFVMSGINTFNSSIQSGRTGGQALGDTAITMSGLAALLAALPSFDVGADRLSSDGRGIDGKGGFLAINHPNERILTDKQNERIGFDTKNEDLANVFSFYKKGFLVPAHTIGATVAVNDNRELLSRIDQGFSKINNWNISAEELFGTITVLIDQSKNGNVHRTKRKYNS